MNIFQISKSSSAKTEFSVFFRYSFRRFSFFFGFFNTDVGVGFGFLKYRDIGFGFRLPTRLYSRLQSLRPSSLWFSYAEVVFYIDHYFVSVDESYQLGPRSLTCLECRFYRNISLHCRRNFRITYDNRRRRQTVCSRKLTREANRSGGWQWAWCADHMFLCQ